jgi:hypothetical protein
MTRELGFDFRGEGAEVFRHNVQINSGANLASCSVDNGDSLHAQINSGANLASCSVDNGLSLLGGKTAQLLTIHLHLMPKIKNDWSYTSIIRLMVGYSDDHLHLPLDLYTASVV